MSDSPQQLFRLSAALWVAAAVLLGLGIGSAQNATVREYVFYVIATVGLFLLIRLWRTPSRSSKVQPVPLLPDSTLPRVDISNVGEAVEPLSSQKAREWLDAFLQDQQSSD